MKKILGIMLLASLAVAGCKKKDTEPEARPSVSLEAPRVVMIRAEADGAMEDATYRGVLNVTNNFKGDIVLKKVEFQGTIGNQAAEAGSQDLDFSLSPGASTEVKLDTTIQWKDDAEVKAQKAAFTGTLHYRGPGGKMQEEPFSFQAPLEVRGE